MRITKNLFYYGIKGLLLAYTPCFFKSIRVFGREHLPTDGGLLLSPNHQGAFLDPLLVGIYLPGKIHSLTRGDVFVKPFKWFFDAMQMLPVFRIRNGFSTLKNNEATFKKCYDLLGQKKSLMMFSEGLHHKEMYLYPISKGSSRIAYHAQKQNPNTPIYLVPVGINYQQYERPWSGLQIVYGKAIPVQPFLHQQDSEAKIINQIRAQLQEGMKACLWIPENSPRYDAQLRHLPKIDPTKDFHHIQKELEQTPITKKQPNAPSSFFKNVWIMILSGLFYIPLYLTKKLMLHLQDPIFGGAVKYAAGLFIFPVYLLLFSLLISILTNPSLGFISLSIHVLSVYLYVSLKA